MQHAKVKGSGGLLPKFFAKNLEELSMQIVDQKFISDCSIRVLILCVESDPINWAACYSFVLYLHESYGTNYYAC